MNKEKVRELSEFVIGHQATKITIESLITQWIEQNHPEPVVVGLSDEQVNDLSVTMKWEAGCNEGVVFLKWIKTQSFAQPNYEAEAKYRLALAESNRKLGDLQEELKSQQFTPDWDDAPDWAIRCVNSTRWWNEKGEYIETTNSASFQRPQPTPVVEAGQVWKYKGGSKYQIDSFGRMKLEQHTGWIDCVTFRKLEGRDIGDFFTRALSDFLANFERVQP